LHCPIGHEDDPNAVLDSKLRVLGAPGRNLRVVDAWIFPKIPGYFIVLPVYLAAEKAADDILRSYAATTMPG
jgi:choline dehydrogenase